MMEFIGEKINVLEEEYYMAVLGKNEKFVLKEDDYVLVSELNDETRIKFAERNILAICKIVLGYKMK